VHYTAKIITEADGRWLVNFPDCPGCQTFGDSKAEAITRARDALDGWLRVSMEHGDVPPHPKAQRGVVITVEARLGIAMQLRMLRNAEGLTQGQMAKRVGVSQQQIAKLENPDANPTLETLVAIADKTGADFAVSLVPRAKGKVSR
jgi:predicted RNase H-like HicB family nuclease/DNA-binding XRE family transcriptional regulator